MTDPYYSDDAVTLYHGDSREVLKHLDEGSVDAVVTDPPYGLEFMGKDWDRPWAVSPQQRVGFEGREANLTLPSFGDNRNANCRGCGGRQRGKKRCICTSPQWDRKPSSDMAEFESWCTEWAIECLRVLKPGGHLLAFGGTRTWHRLACAIEDAGFEVRDSIAWMYGSGFPKSLDVSKAIDKAAGAEREVVGQKQVTNASQGPGSGGLGRGDLVGGKVRAGLIDVTAPATLKAAQQWQGWGTALKPAFEPIVVARKPLTGTVAENVQQWGTGALNIDGCRIAGEPWQAHRATGLGSVKFFTEGDNPEIDKQPHTLGRWPANVILDESQAAELDRQSGVIPAKRNGIGYMGGAVGTEGEKCTTGESGGASRFFYTAKADSSERPRVDGIAHPTVKPLSLLRYLVRLVTPPGGTVLEPFAGSGTTAEACIIEGFRCVAIEITDDYLPLIMQRITKPIDVTLL